MTWLLNCAARLAMVASVLLASTTASSQYAPLKIDVTRLGPQVGERIGDFSLPDQSGTVRTRDALMGPNGLMLVLSRTGVPTARLNWSSCNRGCRSSRRRGLGWRR